MTDTTLSAWAVLLTLTALSAVGCGDGSPTGSGSEIAAELDDVEPIVISEAAALLKRARQPGLEERILICERILRDYPDAPESEEALHLLAQTHQARNEFDRAHARYTEQVTRYPGSHLNVRAHEYLWNYEKKISKDPDAYRSALERAIADIGLYLENNPSEWDSSHGLDLANTQLEAEDREGALATYSRIAACEGEPNEAEAQVRITAQFHIGNIHFERGSLERAIEAFERSGELVDLFADRMPAIARDAYRESVAQSIEKARSSTPAGAQDATGIDESADRDSAGG